MLFFFLLLTSFIQFPIAVCACVAYVVCVCVTVCVMCVAQGWVEVGVMVVVVHAWSCSLLPCNLNPFGKGSGVCTSEDDQINQLDLSPLSET